MMHQLTYGLVASIALASVVLTQDLLEARLKHVSPSVANGWADQTGSWPEDVKCIKLWQRVSAAVNGKQGPGSEVPTSAEISAKLAQVDLKLLPKLYSSMISQLDAQTGIKGLTLVADCADTLKSLKAARRIEQIGTKTMTKWAYQVQDWPEVAKCINLWKRTNAFINGEPEPSPQQPDEFEIYATLPQVDVSVLRKLHLSLLSQKSEYSPPEGLALAGDCVSTLQQLKDVL